MLLCNKNIAFLPKKNINRKKEKYSKTAYETKSRTCLATSVVLLYLNLQDQIMVLVFHFIYQALERFNAE